MHKDFIKKLDKLVIKAKKLEKFFSSKNISYNSKIYNKMLKEYSKIKPIVFSYLEYKLELENINTAKELLLSNEKKKFILNEINISKKNIFVLTNNLKKMLLSLSNKNNKNNIFIEIRAGAGGEESSLFVNDLLRMYIKFSEKKKWKTKIISFSISNIGGYKEVILHIIGYKVYSLLKFESGVHRVQRVPNTESQGRIHTSTCTVIVIPEVKKTENITINLSDIRIDTFKSSGAGGQHVNKTDSAVRIFHIPTGIIVECQSSRSQYKNKSLALKILLAKIKNLKIKEQKINDSIARKLLIGSGDRSERIRTYNFFQNRITDHRINLTLYKLNYIINGDLENIIYNLILYYNLKKISNT